MPLRDRPDMPCRDYSNHTVRGHLAPLSYLEAAQ